MLFELEEAVDTADRRAVRDPGKDRRRRVYDAPVMISKNEPRAPRRVDASLEASHDRSRANRETRWASRRQLLRAGGARSSRIRPVWSLALAALGLSGRDFELERGLERSCRRQQADDARCRAAPRRCRRAPRALVRAARSLGRVGLRSGSASAPVGGVSLAGAASVMTRPTTPPVAAVSVGTLALPWHQMASTTTVTSSRRVARRVAEPPSQPARRRRSMLSERWSTARRPSRERLEGTARPEVEFIVPGSGPYCARVERSKG